MQVRGKRAGDRKGSQVQSKKPKKGSEKGGAVSANVASERSTKQELRSKNAGAAGGGPDPYSLKHSADPACSRGSASEEELPAARAKKSLQAARARSKKTRKKKQEARSNYRQQAARSKKQEARKQQAAGRQVRELVFLSIQKATLGRRLEDSSES